MYGNRSMPAGIVLCVALGLVAFSPAPVLAHRLGDLNCDGAVNAFDIDPFIALLTRR